MRKLGVAAGFSDFAPGSEGAAMKTVNEVVSNWTEEERTELRDLIEECRQREKELTVNSKKRDRNLTELTDSLHGLVLSSYQTKKTLERLRDDLERTFSRSDGTKWPSC